jgi:glucose uptake protein GlcU
VWFSFIEPCPPLHLRSTLPIGILSGLLWNISNILAIVAIPSLGYGVAYPILQCALFVAGIWGITVFKEIQGRAIGVFFISGGILISGAVCVAVASG